MGSGSSKSKKSETSKTNQADKVGKVPAGQGKPGKPLKSETISIDQTNKTQKTHNVTEIEKLKTVKNIEKAPERTANEINSSSNGNLTKTDLSKKIDSFDSDSESEAEDISAVLAATRAENDYNKARQNSNRPTEYYPETYAQRLQREQYARTQQSLVRQKTIYRNPDEWEVDEKKIEEREDTFDVSKFKEANVAKAPQNPVNRDIFSPPDVQQNGYQTKTERYYNQTNSQKNENLPRYDTSEEALLAEIEQEYDL